MEMDRVTRSGKRKMSEERVTKLTTARKRSKSTPERVLTQSGPNSSVLSGRPFLNKNAKVEFASKVKSSKGMAGKQSAVSTGENNSALPDDARPQTSGAGQSSKGLTSQQIDQGQVDDCDHIRVALRDSEDEFADDESQELGYNEEFLIESDSDANAYSEQSEVVISQRTLEIQKQQEAEHINRMANHPEMQKMVLGMVGQELKKALNDADYAAKILDMQPTNKAANNAKGKKTNKDKSKVVPRTVKSPSDTTIYAPALNLTPDKNTQQPGLATESQVVVRNVEEFLNGVRMEHDALSQMQSLNIVEVPQLELQPRPGPSQQVKMLQNPSPDEEVTQNWIDHARETAGQLLTNADQWKTRLDGPRGTGSIPLNYDQIDDQFFHITCHVDKSIKDKIEAGKFVELEKLLIKDIHEAWQ